MHLVDPIYICHQISKTRTNFPPPKGKPGEKLITVGFQGFFTNALYPYSVKTTDFILAQCLMHKKFMKFLSQPQNYL